MEKFSRERLWIVVALVLAVVFFAVATAVGGATLLLWVGGVGLLASAGLTVLLRDRPAPLPGGRTAIVVTTLVVAAALGARVAMLAAGATSTAGMPTELTLPSSATASVQSVADHRPQRMTFDQAAREAGESQIEASFSALRDKAVAEPPLRARALAKAAGNAGYIPRSGLQQDFASATATRLGKTTFLTVPMRGTNLAEMTKVVYAIEGQQTTILEYAAGVIDQSHARLAVWQDGAQVRDVEIYDPAQDTVGGARDGATALNAGFSWSKLNRCLLNAGVSQWIIITLTAACGLTCALTAGTGCILCLAAATGFGAGTIGGCVYYART